MMGSTLRLERSTSTGCSSRQETHHDAQTFSNQTLPCISAGVKTASEFNCGSEKSGAALSIKGEGISRGSRVKPTPNKTTSRAKATSIQAYLFFMMRTLNGLVIARVATITIAPVKQGNQTAQRHEDAAAPNPVHQRFVIHAYRPFGFRVGAVDGFA